MMHQAHESDGPGLEAIAFQVGGQRFCIEVLSVREIRGWSPATPLPNAPPYVLGVVNLRGTVLPVIDLGARLGLPPADPTERHVMIVVCLGDRLVGLLVDAVSEIVTLPDSAVQPTPDVVSDEVRALVKGVVSLDGGLASLIQLDCMLPQAAEAA
jgi:purine-binding chemotaxis protein CheW